MPRPHKPHAHRRAGPPSTGRWPERKSTDGPEIVLGVAVSTKQGWRLRPISRKQKFMVILDQTERHALEPDTLLRVEVKPQPRHSTAPPHGRILDVLGPAFAQKGYSHLAAASHDIPETFSEDALRQANAAKPALLEDREDLRAIPLITIDGADARDFDDAVFAEAEPGGGHHLIVAIADVAHYVPYGSPLDIAAQARGNSVYFPDRVIPMLPEALSNDLCSLRPQEDRACLAVHLWIDANGALIRWRFARALMRSAARLTYEQVEAAHAGRALDIAPTGRIPALYAAFHTLLAARQRRGTLDLDIPERKVELNAQGQVHTIKLRERLDSHRLIEEFMVLANVAAAQALQKKKRAGLYRIHDLPPADRLELLGEFLKSLGYKLAKGQSPTADMLTGILEKFAGTPEYPLVSEMLLRTQSQAAYSPNNIGHFGLALDDYAHFTSPIRRYADLVVHRALIEAYGLGENGALHDKAALEVLGEHLGMTERRAAQAERETVERYLAQHMAEKVDAEFTGRISGVQNYGLFVRLDDTGAEGLLPIRRLPQDFYRHDEARQTLTGARNGMRFRLFDPITVRLAEADAITGSLSFDWAGGLPQNSRKPKQEKPDRRARRRQMRENNQRRKPRTPKHKGKDPDA